MVSSVKPLLARKRHVFGPAPRRATIELARADSASSAAIASSASSGATP